MQRKQRIDLTIDVMKKAMLLNLEGIVSKGELDEIRAIMLEFTLGEITFNTMMDCLMGESNAIFEYLNGVYV